MPTLAVAITMTDRTRSAKAAYHHGDLHAALLKAARGLLEAQGTAGVTLRAAARAAGVSHAAPQHHFGDLTGLLSDLAAEGLSEMRARLQTAAAEPDPRRRVEALGFAYVSYAVDHPAMFMLMYRSERLDPTRPSLRASLDLARDTLAGEIAGLPQDSGSEQHYTRSERGRILRAWAVVHGFSMLLLDGRLAEALSGVTGGDWRRLLGEVFDPDEKRSAGAGAGVGAGAGASAGAGARVGSGVGVGVGVRVASKAALGEKSSLVKKAAVASKARVTGKPPLPKTPVALPNAALPNAALPKAALAKAALAKAELAKPALPKPGLPKAAGKRAGAQGRKPTRRQTD